MSRVVLWLRRSLARRGLLAATAATCVVATFLIVTIAGFALQSERPAVRATVVAGPVPTVSVRAETTLDTNASAQDAAARTVITHEMRGVDVHVYRSVTTAPVALAPARATRPGLATAILLEDAGAVRDRIHVVAGQWPPGVRPVTGLPESYPVAVQATAAGLLGLKVGDAVDIPSDAGALHLWVAATWRADDAADPLWFGDRQVVTGRSGAAVGPLIVGSDALAHLDATPVVSWVVTPDAAALTPAQLPQLVRGFGALSGALGTDAAVTSTIVTVSGDGGQTARGMTTSLASLGAVVSLPIAVLSVALVLALILLARLLADTRAAETTLLRARGATAATLMRAAAAESAPIGAVGALVGVAGASVALALGTGSLPPPAVLVVPTLLVLLTVIVVQLGVVGISLRGGLGTVREAGRARSVASLGFTALVVVAAGFTLWRFLQYGTGGGITGGTAGGAADGSLDPTGVIAPALALLAAVLLGLAVFGPLTRTVENGASRGPRVIPVLPARQLGRGLGFFVAPAALIILTVATTTLAAGFVGTWSAYRVSAAHVVNAGDLRVSTGTAAPVLGINDGADAAAYAAVRGVTAAIPAMRGNAVLGTGTAPVVAVPVARLADAMAPDGGAIDADGIRSALASAGSTSAGSAAGATMAGIALPRGTRSLSIAYTATVAPPAAATADGDTAPRTIQVTVWLADVDGTVVPATYPATVLATLSEAAKPAAAATVVTKPADLPIGGPWQIVAVDAAFSGGVLGDHYRWTLSGATARSGATAQAGVDVAVAVSGAHGWHVAPDAFGMAPSGTGASGTGGTSTDSPPRSVATGIGLTATKTDASLGSTVRLMPGQARRPAVVVTATLARANGLSVGDSVSLDGGWWATAATIAKIVPVVPGEHSEAVLFDLPTLQEALLRSSATPVAANEIWIASAHPEQVLPAVSAVAGPGAVVMLPDTTFVERFLGAATLALWLGCTGCVALAVIALSAAAAALSRRRRPEVAVFRALGFSARQQRRSRGGELAVVATIAAVIGVVAGALVALLVVPTLTQLTVVTAPAALPVQAAVDPILLSIGYLVVVAAIAGVVLAYSAAVGRQAGDTEYREATL